MKIKTKKADKTIEYYWVDSVGFIDLTDSPILAKMMPNCPYQVDFKLRYDFVVNETKQCTTPVSFELVDVVSFNPTDFDKVAVAVSIFTKLVDSARKQ